MSDVAKRFAPYLIGLMVPVLLLLASSVSARPRNADEAAAAVRTWLEQALADGRQNVSILKVDSWPDADEPTSYIVHLADGGYCLAGADDLSVPVLFYGIEGDYDPTNPGLQLFLAETRDRLADLQSARAKGDLRLAEIDEKLTQRAELWDDLVAGMKPAAADLKSDKADPDYVVLPLTSSWIQTGVFNDQCPAIDGPPGATLPTKVGCVATAAAQIMYYWQWPNQGAGSREGVWLNFVFDTPQERDCANDPGIDPTEWAGRLSWSATPEPHITVSGTWENTMYDRAIKDHLDAGFRSALANIFDNYPAAQLRMVDADFGSATYDWDLIQDVHMLSDGVDAGDEEVAELCFHVGVMADMNWGVYRSTAQTSDVFMRLDTNFRYSSDLEYTGRNVNTMRDEIAMYRPVLIRGSNSEGAGHAWVVFGYDQTGVGNVFMMNLGWGGSSIGWFHIDDVFLDYYLDQAHVTHIAPASVVRFVDESMIINGDGTPDFPYWNLPSALFAAPDDATIVMRAGQEYIVSGEWTVIDRPRTLKGSSVVIRQAWPGKP